MRVSSVFKVFIFISFAFLSAAAEAEMNTGHPLPDYESFGSFSSAVEGGEIFSVTDPLLYTAQMGDGILKSEISAGFLRMLEDFKRRGGKPTPYQYTDPDEEILAWSIHTEEDPGVRQYGIAEALRKSGRYAQAVKAYYAVLLHYGNSVQWSRQRQFYWHLAPEAYSRIRRITAEHQDLGFYLDGFDIYIDRKNNDDPQDDLVKIKPGRFMQGESKNTALEGQKIIQKKGGDVTSVVQYENGDWQLFFNNQPFFIKGISYLVSVIGETPHLGTLRSWVYLDDNNNGLNDGMMDSWVDKNRNNKRDDDEPVVGDAVLLQRMGVNTIRMYHTASDNGEYNPKDYDKPLMRKLAEEYGIYFVMGDYFGAYTLGSGARWVPGTDYNNPAQKEQMLRTVRNMVLDHKDEPYVLFWLLGNENQHAFTHTNANEYPAEYMKFLNEAAIMIKTIDPTRPVAVCNLTSEGLNELEQYAPEVDIYGANVYSGAYSMGSTVQNVKIRLNRPLVFTEWGSDAYHDKNGVDEKMQSRYLRGNWKDIVLHSAGQRGEGNVIGGILFEWMDEWWKSSKNGPEAQSTAGDLDLPFEDGWSHEEWLGVVGQGDGKNSPFQRILRQGYYTMMELWRKEASDER